MNPYIYLYKTEKFVILRKTLRKNISPNTEIYGGTFFRDPLPERMMSDFSAPEADMRLVKIEYSVSRNSNHGTVSDAMTACGLWDIIIFIPAR